MYFSFMLTPNPTGQTKTFSNFSSLKTNSQDLKKCTELYLIILSTCRSAIYNCCSLRSYRRTVVQRLCRSGEVQLFWHTKRPSTILKITFFFARKKIFFLFLNFRTWNKSFFKFDSSRVLLWTMDQFPDCNFSTCTYFQENSLISHYFL